MTHTSTEQQIAEAWNEQADEFNQWDELDLEEKIEWAAKYGASKTHRKPLTDAQIKEGRNAVNDDPDDRPEPWAFREGVKFAERMHGITQEKQG